MCGFSHSFSDIRRQHDVVKIILSDERIAIMAEVVADRPAGKSGVIILVEPVGLVITLHIDVTRPGIEIIIADLGRDLACRIASCSDFSRRS